MAGSKKGERRGGRQKGTPNKKTAALLERIAASGKTPLEFFCTLMNDENADMELRFSAAERALPYVHAQRLPESGDGQAASGGVQIIITGTDAKL